MRRSQRPAHPRPRRTDVGEHLLRRCARRGPEDRERVGDALFQLGDVDARDGAARLALERRVEGEVRDAERQDGRAVKHDVRVPVRLAGGGAVSLGHVQIEAVEAGRELALRREVVEDERPPDRHRAEQVLALL